jgi:polygalacturonase
MRYLRLLLVSQSKLQLRTGHLVATVVTACSLALAGCGGSDSSGDASTAAIAAHQRSNASTTQASTTANFVAPTLVNPVDPTQYGAKCDGVTDDSSAFQAAVNAGDVKVPASTCVINKTVAINVSYRHIECAPGAVLKQTDAYAANMFNVFFSRWWNTYWCLFTFAEMC